MNPEKAVQGASEAFAALMAVLESGLSDGVTLKPSRLAGWSVGHILTHLARNANGCERVIRAARQGRVVDQYPGGVTQRHEEIESGSRRGLAEQVEDLIASETALADAFSQLTTDDWAVRTRRWGSQPWPVSDIPFLRWRELSIHTVDLGFDGIGIDAWGDNYVEAELHRQLSALPNRLDRRVLLDVRPTDKDWNLVLLSPGDGLGSALMIEDTSRRILAWVVDRADALVGWPALSTWQGVP